MSTSFVESLRHRARAARRTLVFPEYRDARVHEAMQQVQSEGLAQPVAIGPGTLNDMPVLNPEHDSRTEQIANLLLAKRARKGMTLPEAQALATQPLYFANGLVALGEVHGCVAGAVHTTGDVVRAALWSVGLAPGVTSLSSAFYMVVQPFRSDVAEVLTFTDCAIIPEPSVRQLTDIAVAAARDRRRIVGDEPCVAMLSYSTAGSAEGTSVNRIREACALLARDVPDLHVDGELQGDAALVRAVGQRKAPGSSVAGRANILVFPSLDAGNIAYKLVQRLGHALAIGPILQGLARPCNDLSRGATVNDIVLVAAITALQSISDTP